MIERCCSLARRMADQLGRADGVTILNDVVLNQVLVRFEPPAGGDADAFTRAVIAARPGGRDVLAGRHDMARR